MSLQDNENLQQIIELQAKKRLTQIEQKKLVALTKKYNISDNLIK